MSKFYGLWIASWWKILENNPHVSWIFSTHYYIRVFVYLRDPPTIFFITLFLPYFSVKVLPPKMRFSLFFIFPSFLFLLNSLYKINNYCSLSSKTCHLSWCFVTSEFTFYIFSWVLFIHILLKNLPVRLTLKFSGMCLFIIWSDFFSILCAITSPLVPNVVVDAFSSFIS